MNLSSLFWKIFIAVIMFVSGVAFIILNVKKVLEKFKEFRIKQKITVMPISNHPDISISNTQSKYQLGSMKQFLEFNNSKYNDPMFTGPQMAALVIFSFGMSQSCEVKVQVWVFPNECQNKSLRDFYGMSDLEITIQAIQTYRINIPGK